MKYIDAEKLKERIEKLDMESCIPDTWDGFYYAIDSVLEVITSLQQEQPEVDLEVRKQIEELANDWHHKGFASDEDCPLCMQDLMDILWHFYELGLNARKEG